MAEREQEEGVADVADEAIPAPEWEDAEPAAGRLEPGLYVVGTPIGNMADITLRALTVLRGAHVVYAEDTRHTGMLLSRHGIRVPLASCHRFNEAARAGEVVARIRGGQAAALVTNAGMPAVSDPGSRLVAAARAAGLPVTVIPGPSAVTAALALSGFGRGAGFVFEGFLPRKPGARRRRLAELAAFEVPVVLYESPFRLVAVLGELEAVLGERPVFVAREMTKKFEEGRSGSAAELRAYFGGRTVRGEITVVLAPRD